MNKLKILSVFIVFMILCFMYSNYEYIKILYTTGELKIENSKKIKEGIQIRGKIIISENISTDFRMIIKDKSEKHRLFFVLDGLKQGQKVLDLIDKNYFLNRNYALLSMDYFFDVEETGKEIKSMLNNIFKIKKSIFLNISLIKTLLENMQKFDFISENNGLFCGISLGGFIGTYPVSCYENRFSDIIYMYSGGNIQSVVNNKFPDIYKNFFLGIIIDSAIRYNLYIGEPVNFINRFSEKKVLFINSKDDKVIPLKSAKALYDNFKGKNSSVVLLNGQHIGANKINVIHSAFEKVYEWIDNRKGKNR